MASFHAIIFAYGRQIYSLSRAGYFPLWLSRTHATRRTPVAALLVGAALGYAVALAIFLLGPKHPVGAVLLNMAVFGAVISYMTPDGGVHPAAQAPAGDPLAPTAAPSAFPALGSRSRSRRSRCTRSLPLIPSTAASRSER